MGLLLFPVPDFPVPFRIRGLDYGCELLCRDLLDRTALILGFNSGMRVSEITHIDVGMIDFENERIKIWDEKKDRYRVVYPGKVAMSMISLYMKEKNIKGPRLFDLNEKTLERHFQKLTSSALNDKRSWHTVRHTYITICSRRRIDHKIIMENTGDSLQTIKHDPRSSHRKRVPRIL